MSNGAFPDPIHTLKECSLKYNTFTEMNFNRFDFSDGNEIVGSMFAKCEMQLANFKATASSPAVIPTPRKPPPAYRETSAGLFGQ